MTHYAELHCLTNFSFLRGASHPEEMVTRALKLGYEALAITDECSVAGVVRAYQAARNTTLKLLVGSEFLAPAERLHVVVLARDLRGYGQLCRLITRCRRRASKGEYQFQVSDLETELLDHCLLLWKPRQALDQEAGRSADRLLGQRLQALAGDHLWLLGERHLSDDDQERLAHVQYLSASLALPVVAGSEAHTHSPKRQRLQDAVTAIRHRCTLAEAGQRLFPNAERTLRSRPKLARLFPQAWLDETVAVARRCSFSLSELRYEYPGEFIPAGSTPQAWLRQLVREGERVRFPEGTPSAISERIEHELKLIGELRYEPYFLTLHDIVRFARNQGILCQGRGSAANSVVCYCLLITEVDPRQVDMLFERFISQSRNEPPDIDVDFEHDRREEVIQYIYSRYGRERAALAATVIRYRPKSAIRDIGKALGLDPTHIEQLLQGLDWRDREDNWLEQIRRKGLLASEGLAAHFVDLVQTLLNFPRHLSQHVGGFVITASAVTDYVPIENAAMADRTVIQWDKDDLESLGLMKVDILALGMLSAIRRTLELIGSYDDQYAGVQSIPREDPQVYAMLQRGDSMGVFQVESRAQMAMLPRLKPSCYYDLVIQVAIVRPGPIQGGMVHPYLRRRQGLEDFAYPNEAIKQVLERTLGVPIFQEQVIRLAMAAAGFSASEADRLRRAMAAWKRRGTLEPFRDKLIAGILEHGHSRQFAEQLFEQIKGFGGYGFPESHSASFALLVYVSAWLKCYHPAAFCCALLNSQPMGFYSPSQLVQDVRRHGVEVRPVDVNHSGWDHSLTATADAGKPALRLGLRLIKGLSRQGARRLLAARPPGGFSSLGDIRRRARPDTRDLEALASANAFGSLSNHRHQARWDLLDVPLESPLFRNESVESAEIAEGAKGVESVERAKNPGIEEAPADYLHRFQSHQPENDSHQPENERHQFEGESRQPECESRQPVPSGDSQEVDAVQLPAPTEGRGLLEDYASLGLSLARHPLALLREQDHLRHCVTANDLTALAHGRPVAVAGLVTGRQRPGSASGVTFVTLEDETGSINVVVWLATARQQRRPLLTARLLRVHGILERQGSVTHVIAGRLLDLSHLISTLDVSSRDFH